MAQITFRILEDRDLSPFLSYLLSGPAGQLRRGAPGWLAVGAVRDRMACGAAAVQLRGEEAELASFFVDPQVRGQRVGSRLLDRTTALARERGCRRMGLHYLLAGDDLAAMDRLVRRRGELVEGSGSFVYRMELAPYRDHPLVGPSFRPEFRPVPAVVPFSRLTGDQLDALEAREEIPGFLLPSFLRDRMDPELSVAWIEDGRVTAYLLGGSTQYRDASLLAAWLERPASAFLHLLREQLNRFYYRFGGEFRLFVSPVTPHAEQMLQRLTEGKYTRYEARVGVLSLI